MRRHVWTDKNRLLAIVIGLVSPWPRLEQRYRGRLSSDHWHPAIYSLTLLLLFIMTKPQKHSRVPTRKGLFATYQRIQKVCGVRIISRWHDLSEEGLTSQQKDHLEVCRNPDRDFA